MGNGIELGQFTESKSMKIMDGEGDKLSEEDWIYWGGEVLVAQ